MAWTAIGILIGKAGRFLDESYTSFLRAFRDLKNHVFPTKNIIKLSNNVEV